MTSIMVAGLMCANKSQCMGSQHIMKTMRVRERIKCKYLCSAAQSINWLNRSVGRSVGGAVVWCGVVLCGMKRQRFTQICETLRRALHTNVKSKTDRTGEMRAGRRRMHTHIPTHMRTVRRRRRATSVARRLI